MYGHNNPFIDKQTYTRTYKPMYVHTKFYAQSTNTQIYVRTRYVRTHKPEYGHVLLYYTTVGEFVIED